MGWTHTKPDVRSEPANQGPRLRLKWSPRSHLIYIQVRSDAVSSLVLEIDMGWTHTKPDVKSEPANQGPRLRLKLPLLSYLNHMQVRSDGAIMSSPHPERVR